MPPPKQGPQGEQGGEGMRGPAGEPGERGPMGFPGRSFPDVPQSWFEFLAKIASLVGIMIAFGTLILTQVQGCHSREVQAQHGEAIEENKEKIEKHADKIDQIKAAMPPEK